MGNLGFSDVPCEPYKMNKVLFLFLSLCVHSWEGASYGIRLFAEPCDNQFGGAWKPVESGEGAYEGEEWQQMPSVKWGPLWPRPSEPGVWAALERLSLGLARGQELWPPPTPSLHYVILLIFYLFTFLASKLVEKWEKQHLPWNL